MCISQTKNADHLLMIKKNKYGQYFTIEAIAEFMVSLVKQGNVNSTSKCKFT